MKRQDIYSCLSGYQTVVRSPERSEERKRRKRRKKNRKLGRKREKIERQAKRNTNFIGRKEVYSLL